MNLLKKAENIARKQVPAVILGGALLGELDQLVKPACSNHCTFFRVDTYKI